MNKIDISKNVHKKINIKGVCIMLLIVIAVIIIFDFFYRIFTKDNNIEQTSYAIVTEATDTTIGSELPTSEPTQTEVSQTIDSSLYNTVNKSMDDISKGALAVINTEHPTNFPDISDKLSTFNYYYGTGYKLSDFNIEVCQDIIEPFNNMLLDFYNQTQIPYTTIVQGYTNSDADDSNGTSDSCSGYALEFKVVTESQILDFDGTGEYAWFEENCYKYGFVLRYPDSKSSITNTEYTPNHFRYVGIPHSNIMQDKNLCLEEYIDFLKDYNFYKEHLYLTIGSINYEIYYVPAETTGNTSVPVPKDEYYVISGNNVDGFIVTILK